MSCKTVGRGVGLWGDMVLALKDGGVVELRSLDRFLEIRKYIEERVEEAKAGGARRGGGGGEKGFA